ncbi:MAG: hypothetical protein AAGB93_09235 [Planctomycetota bacterium]
MFSNLSEDWPWIVVPMIVVAIVSVAIVLAFAPDDAPLFTYGL